MEAALHPQETVRLEALHRYAILDSPPEQRFDAVTELAANLFGAPGQGCAVAFTVPLCA